MQTLGSWLELLGAIITGAGLSYAWNRASGRFDEWRETLRTRLTELQAFVASRGRGMAREVAGGLSVAVETVAEIEVTRGGTEHERLQRVEREVEALKDRLTKSLESVPSEIGKAIATELGRFQSQSNAIHLKDIYWTLGGVAVDAVGIAIHIVAGIPNPVGVCVVVRAQDGPSLPIV